MVPPFPQPGKREELESRMRRPLTFMSSVVALELFAGCRTRRQRQALTSFLKPFEKAGRVITPDHAAFRNTGMVLAKLGAGGIGVEHRRRIGNDVLIALTAARSGAVVITFNTRDFLLIEKHIPVRWMPAE